ncbi:hypothetical protein BO83DRAFT_380688 [Aspergillus eucalypticola CBS 122712]|uniref:Life-span regulatory factor domain-containing protein n=1 Tax=Aspergillus eucalypticola (strain CBS 122712 / IBT 29274) TaxID=1448314 RepID=A0A317V265_ASPEC|nr:uncharacterized protein BO83DRAFT_380688 [Aspergillus eucalypticola CBS 122712]PWY67491.1 hypothetical protein BO83DRAFT_380688 [Aspergillus eucalypticola CBS 122712]
MATEWSLDFCLACDRQTLGEPYCSQACRLAELDTASKEATAPHAIVCPQPTRAPSQAGRSVTGSFATMGTAPAGSPGSQYPKRVLSPSSSQTSLSSVKSSSSRSFVVASQFKNELRDYACSFDHVRDLKRRFAS